MSYLICCFLFCAAQAFSKTNDKANFWLTQKNGANYRQTLPAPDSWYAQTKKNKSDFVYLVFNADFFCSKADMNFQSSKTQKTIENFMENAKKYNLKVVVELPPIENLPGGSIIEVRSMEEFQKKMEDRLLRCWKKIVCALKKYSGVVAYSIPGNWALHGLAEKNYNFHDFHTRTITEIRNIDSQTPIILKPSYDEFYGYTSPKFKPIRENNILYAMEIHMVFPTMCRTEVSGSPSQEELDTAEQEQRKNAKQTLEELAMYAKQYGISPQQLLILDFSSDRPCCKNIKPVDLTSFLNSVNTNNWHWSYSYVHLK